MHPKKCNCFLFFIGSKALINETTKFTLIANIYLSQIQTIERDKNMGLVKCPDCSKDVSDQAATCIHCGSPLKETPSVNMAHNVQKGVQRSKLKSESGNTIGIMGLLIGAVLCFFNLGLGIAVIIGSVAIGLWLAYT